MPFRSQFVTGLTAFCAAACWLHAQPAAFTVDAGTKVPLALINSISTKHSLEGDRVYLRLKMVPQLRTAATKCVNTELLGKAKIPALAYENADGSPLVIDSDYFGRKRKSSSPFVGPFEDPGQGDLKLKVW